MRFLRVEIIGFVEEHQPGFVRCAFVDAGGMRHTFIEKIPVASKDDLWIDSLYPQPGAVPCLSVEALQDGTGRALTRVTIDVGDSMDSFKYSAPFVVLESQLS